MSSNRVLFIFLFITLTLMADKKENAVSLESNAKRVLKGSIQITVGVASAVLATWCLNNATKSAENACRQNFQDKLFAGFLVPAVGFLIGGVVSGGFAFYNIFSPLYRVSQWAQDAQQPKKHSKNSDSSPNKVHSSDTDCFYCGRGGPQK